ncbi:MAG: hypothetical protein Q9163_001487, partial [Psora crenata]
MVKILMLHGFGVNAAIFEAQTAPIRALLPSHWEYYFLQGPLECGPAPGIGDIYPGQKYNCWFHVPSLIEIQSVHSFLEDVIEDEGPFDAAWGFSAGAMVLGSLILRYAHETPYLPQPFRAAIFMHSYMPWSATKEIGVDVTPLLIQHRDMPCTLAETERLLAFEYEKYPTREDMLRDKRKANWVDGDIIPPMMRNAYHDIHAQVVEKGLDRKYNDYEAHRMFPEADKARLQMPTAHILGEHDPFKEQGTTM